MKKLTLFLLALGFQAAVYVCATEVQYFYVDIGQSPVSFALSEHPTITYAGDQLTIATSDRSISLPVADIRSAGFCDDPATGISVPVAAGRPHIAGGTACFMALPAGSQVVVYQADGKQVHRLTVGADGTAEVNLRSFPKGAYIIKSQHQTIKIVNK